MRDISYKYGLEIREISQVNTKASVKKMYATNLYADRCISCDSERELVLFHNAVPVDKNNVAIVPCYRCTHCGKVYVHRFHKQVRRVLKNNPYAAEFSIKYNFYYSENKKVWDTFNSKKTAFLLAILKSGKHFDYAMVVEDENERDYENGIFCYTDYTACELLALFQGKRKKKYITMHGIDYSVVKMVCKVENVLDNYCINSLQIKKNGGYIDDKNPHSEQVEVLLYSSITDRYEKTYASYDFVDKYYYIDLQRLKRFIKDYGKPDIEITVKARSSHVGSMFLRENSILYLLGYNVSQIDDLSDAYRCSLLQDIIDLGFMEQKKIEKFLDWLIETHTAPKYYYALEKWRKDRDYVSKYKMEPNRFVIPIRII